MKCLALVLFLFCQSAFSQKWAKGYIVVSGRGTLQGYIHKTWKGCDGPALKSIDFRASSKSETQTFRPFQIRAFGIGLKDIYVANEVGEVKASFPYLVDDTAVGKQHDSMDVRFQNDGWEGDGVYFKVAGIQLPKNLTKYTKDTIFAHVVLLTNFLFVLETFDSRHRFFFGNGPPVIWSREFVQYEVDAQNIQWTCPEYRNQLTKLLGSIPGISYVEHNKITARINQADYDGNDIPDIVGIISGDYGGPIIYKHKHTGKYRQVSTRAIIMVGKEP